ncbi:MAG: 1-deoxy-D-xylulose-5-phosphate synthase N-terminal domain-containing protein [Thiotrichaceae bacterium]
MVKRTEEHVKGMLIQGTLFEELGFNYIGPVDGHDFTV